MVEHENGKAEKANANATEKPSENASSSESASVEPLKTGIGAAVEVEETKRHSVDSRETGDQTSISDQALVDRIRVSDRWMIALTAVIAIGGLISAYIFWKQLGVLEGHLTAMQGQLTEMRKAAVAMMQNFMQDERAWIAIEPIKPVLLDNAPQFGATFTCHIYPKNVGKTVARDIVVKAQSMFGSENFGNSRDAISSVQEQMLLDKFTEVGTGRPVHVPANPVPKVLAPGAIATAPFRLTCQEPQRHKGGQHLHYIVGRIDYSDEFRVRHWMKFCFFVINSRGELWNCQEGNDEDRNPETPVN